MNDTKHAKTKRIGFESKLMFLFASLIIFFLWILPEIGHKILFKDGYYGLVRTETYNSNEFDCGEENFSRVDGVLMGMYPYSAFVVKSCIVDQEKSEVDNMHYKGYTISIYVKKPHTFIKHMLRMNKKLPVADYDLVYHNKNHVKH